MGDYKVRVQPIYLIHLSRPSVSYAYIDIVLCAFLLLGEIISEVISSAMSVFN